MLKIKSILVSSLVCAAVVGTGFTALENYQPASAEVVSDGNRKDEITQWQNQVDQWNAAASRQAQQTMLSAQGVTQLPNTGPSEQ